MSESAHAHHSPTEAEPDTASVTGMGVSLALLAIVLAVTAYLLYGYFIREAEAVHHSQVLSQKSEALEALRMQERDVLSTYGVVDAEKGIYRLPVSAGIGLFVKEAKERQAAGLPQRAVSKPAPAEEPAASETESK